MISQEMGMRVRFALNIVNNLIRQAKIERQAYGQLTLVRIYLEDILRETDTPEKKTESETRLGGDVPTD